MIRLAKNFILTTAVVNAMIFVDLSSVTAASIQQTCTAEKIFVLDGHVSTRTYLDFWSKFRDTVMPDPNKPQDNNPPKEMHKPKPGKTKLPPRTKPDD